MAHGQNPMGASAGPAPVGASPLPIDSPAAQLLAQPGESLHPRLVSFFGDRLGADFSSVRVHTGGQADRAADSIHASAYTLGHQVVLGSGAGPTTLAHELVHVRQQRDHQSRHVIQRNPRERRDAQSMYNDSSYPFILMEGQMATQLTDRARRGDYGVLHEAFQNVIIGYNRDDVAMEVLRNLSDADLQALAARDGGRQLLTRLRSELESGYTADDETAQITRINTALGTQVTTPLVSFEQDASGRTRATPGAGDSDYLDYPWLNRDPIRDTNQVRVRADGTPTDTQGRVLRPGHAEFQQQAGPAKEWALTVPLGGLSDTRLLSLARFVQWLFQNDTGGTVAADAARVGRRMGEARDEMVQRLRARRYEEQNPIQGPAIRMPTSEPDPLAPRLGPTNPLEGLDRIRNLGAFGSFAMVIAIFATDDIHEALAIAEGVDTVGNFGMLAAGAYRARRSSQSYGITPSGSGSASPIVRGGPLGTETYLTELRRLAASGQLEPHSAPAPAEFLRRIQWDPNQRSSSGQRPTLLWTDSGFQWQAPRSQASGAGQGGAAQGFQFNFNTDPNAGLPPFLRLTEPAASWQGNAGPPTTRLSDGTTVRLQTTTPQQGSYFTPTIRFGGGSGQESSGTPSGTRRAPPSVFQQLVTDPAGNVLETDALVWGRFDTHPNRTAIERNLRAINVAVEADATLTTARGASADVVMVVVTGPGGQSFTRSRIRYAPDQATPQHFHHELNHLLDLQAGRIPRVELTVSDPVRFSQMQTWGVQQLLNEPRPASAGEPLMRNARARAQSSVLEIRNHLRDIAEYGMTSQGGREVPATPQVFSERQRETIRNYVTALRRLRTAPELSETQRGELDTYIRQYVDSAFPELPAEYSRLMGGRRGFYESAGL